MLFLCGVYITGTEAASGRLHRFNGSSRSALAQRVHKIALRVGRCLEGQGWSEGDAENDYLALDTADGDSIRVLQGHSITCRIAFGLQAGREKIALQTLPPVDMDEMHAGTAGQVAGYDRYSGVAARATEWQKLADAKSVESQNSGTFCFSAKVYFWP